MHYFNEINLVVGGEIDMNFHVSKANIQMHVHLCIALNKHKSYTYTHTQNNTK